MVVALAGGPDRLLAYTEGDGGCSGANRLPAPETLEQARTATLCLLNRERAAQGLPPLVADARLALARSCTPTTWESVTSAHRRSFTTYPARAATCA